MKLKLKKNKVNKKKTEINFSAKYLYVMSWVLMIGTTTYLGFFLYKNFYQTVAETDEIILLKQEVAPDTLNTQKIDEVLRSLNKKINNTSTPDYSNVKNPFSPGNNPAANSANISEITPDNE